MSTSRSIQQALRLLLLPIRAQHELECGEALRAFFDAQSVSIEDALSWLSLHLGEWEDSGHPSKALQEAVSLTLKRSDAEFGAAMSENYFKVYSKLRSSHFLEHNEAREFLSHAPLMLDLVKVDRLSAAQIAKVLKERDHRVRFSRQNVADFLRILKFSPTIDKIIIEKLLKEDSDESLSVFADADAPYSAEFISEIATALGFPYNIFKSLAMLFDPIKPTKYIAYIQILHYQCIIAEYYDHAITDLYEFNPRGNTAKWLFEQYKDLATADNPFLNNAKSVERVDDSWVRSKKEKERPGAAALLNILTGLETMGFASRRELARFLRLWVCRVLQLALPKQIMLPARLCPTQWKKLLALLERGNTKSYGIIEQRVVDAITAFLFQKQAGWRSRGLSSSVNATNISQKKFGDCEFQHPVNLEIKAFESHGGKLSQVYVLDHMRTLKKIIESRRDDLSGIADMEKWSATICFVAHELSSDIEIINIEMCGLKVSTMYMNFTTFISEAFNKNIPYKYFDNYVLSVINEHRTPSNVRKLIQHTLNID